MRLRTSSRGPNSGNRFWGCRNYPNCRGIVNIPNTGNTAITSNGAYTDTIQNADTAFRYFPVRWHETRQREDYDYDYVSIGSMPGLIKASFEEDETVRKLLCDSVVFSLRHRKTEDVDEHRRLKSALFMKLLQRGRMPLPTLEIERSAIRVFELDRHTVDLSENRNGEMGWESERGRPYKVDRDKFLARLSERCHFELESGFVESLLDSPYELDYLTRWVPNNLGGEAGHWITPQAPLDTLIESSNKEGEHTGEDRRVDFLVNAPGTDPFVIEIDGPEHERSLEIDRQRDSSLSMDVIRVTNQEIIRGSGPKLEKIKQRGSVGIRDTSSTEVHGSARLADFARDCSIASKIQFVIARSVDRGWLSGNVWNLEIFNGGPVVASAVIDALRAYTAYDTLYGDKSRPDRCVLRTEDGITHGWQYIEEGWIEVQAPEFQEPNLRILVEPDSSPYDKLIQRDVDFIIRPAFLPVELRVDDFSNFERTPISADSYEVAEPALTFFLQNIFRKQNFRQGQGRSIWRTLRQEDTIVLLPTGGGKSIIYQLSGLLMPGITLVVDPIIALIEDQVQGLRRYGIDRAMGISSANDQSERQAILRRVMFGEFQFMLMAPERLQSPEFRKTVSTLRTSSLVNLAVIDEAHCVSEWGHEFRPSYLRLADTLRDVCRDVQGIAPPMLAMTGTASRAVLRDMMIELGVDQSQSDNVVRPDSFDRKELKFDIHRERTLKKGMAVLSGVMRSLPQRFHAPPEQFFNQRGRDTSSGIVFVRTVRAGEWGLLATSRAVSDITGAKVGIYGGSTTPKGYDRREWEHIKRQNAQGFKDNNIPILVATKAFGMGIDKPNIRFVVHNGIPGSIESYYQEAGRAGRDGQTSWCITVTSEFDTRRSDDLLNPNADLEEIRGLYDKLNEERSKWEHMDDVTTALYFHLNSFQGVQKEIQQVSNVLGKLGDLKYANSVKVTYGNSAEQEQVERALVRLVRVGVIRDYQIDWNKKQFLVDVPRFDFNYSKGKVIEQVELAQPKRSRLFAERIEAISNLEPHETVKALASALIEFTYDVIERSRRRAIQESVLLARSETNDTGIRRRIIEYLQEGVDAERIEHLLSDTQDNLDDWWELIEKMQTAVDAGDLRGLAIRALESYPDDPGLLFMRAASEAMCSDRDDRVCVDTFTFSIESCVEYIVNTKQVSELIENLYEFAETRSQELRPLLTMGLLQLNFNRKEYQEFRVQGYVYARNSRHPETAAVASTFALRDAVEKAVSVVDSFRNRYSEKCLQLIGIT